MKKIHIFLCILKSLIFCFRYLPYYQAVKCPILLGLNTEIKIKNKKKTGQIKIIGPVSFRMIKIGVTNGSFDKGEKMRTRVIINKDGLISFGGQCTLTSGSTIVINEGGSLNIGNRCFFNYNTLINVGSTITIDDDFLGGWNISLIDGDGHSLEDIFTGEIINGYKPINIGKNNWVSACATILKGVTLTDNVIIPYGAIITKSCYDNCCIFGGSPNRILKENIKRYG